MSFRYYITDLFEGTVVGTNNKELAEQSSHCEEYYVIDTEVDAWIVAGKYKSIEEWESD